MSLAYERLVQFLDTEMRMSQIYQPVMLEELLTHSGRATIRTIAAAILAHDESQIDYYAEIVKRMPGPVLSRRGIVRRTGDHYVLADGLHDLSASERDELIARCRAKVEAFTRTRGTAIWEHRRPATGIIPGSVRYNTFKRAAGRCELCGIPHEERALDVDHIVPRSEGGTDDSDNLQALCWRCNQDQGAGDATDFRGIRESYAARESGCPFCELADRAVIAENSLAFLIADRFPVTDGHM